MQHNNKPSHTLQVIRALRQGLYSDFEVIVGDTRYYLHRAIVQDHSGYFNACFSSTPQTTSVTFDESHIVGSLPHIWDHIVATWYQDPDYVAVIHDPRDHQQIIECYRLVCEYLSTPIPGLRFDENKRHFLDYRHWVTYRCDTDAIEVTVCGRPMSPIPLKYTGVAYITPDGREDNKERPPTPGTIKAIGSLNRLIEKNTKGRCIDVIKTLAIYHNPSGNVITVMVNGHMAVRSSSFGTNSWTNFHEDIESVIYRTIPHRLSQPKKA